MAKHHLPEPLLTEEELDMKPAPSTPPVVSPLAILSVLALTLGWLAISQRDNAGESKTAGIESLVPAGSKYTAAYSDPELNPDIIDSGGFRTEANSGSLSYLAEAGEKAATNSSTASEVSPPSAKVRRITPAGKAESASEGSDALSR